MSATGKYCDGTNHINTWSSRFTHIYKFRKSAAKEWKRRVFIPDFTPIPSADIYFQYGFNVLGPLVFGFIKWLHEMATAQKINRLYFLSRDGYLLLHAYERLYPQDKTMVSYLYISRKIAREAQLWLKPNLCDVYNLFPAYTYLKCEEFCAYFNVESEEALHYWKDCGLPEEMRFLPKDLLTDQHLKNFYEKIKLKIIEASKKTYTKLIRYFEQNQICGRVGIVDIGWNGTIQNCLETVLQQDTDPKHEIVGFYLGLTSEAAKADNKYSYIAVGEEPQEFDAGFVEYPFLAPEGSLLRYADGQDGCVVPVLANYEHDQKEHNIVQGMQEGTLYFIECAKTCNPVNFTWDATFAYAALKRISKHPTLRECKIFGDLAYYDGEKRYLAAPRSLVHYLLHPRDFPYDLSVSGWRIGFLKRFLKLNLDYNRLLKIYKHAHGD